MSDEDSEDEAARAFYALRADVNLMRRAVEHLTAERQEAPELPDYSETLGVISHNLTATAQRVDALVESPALSLTPDALATQITSARSMARADDHRELAAARQGLDDTTRQLGGYMVSQRLAFEQNRWLWFMALAGLIAGMMIWAVFAGIVARVVPASWQWPERMAARSLDMSIWAAGQDLMASADPRTWDGIVAGNRIVAANRAALGACQQAAMKAKKPIRCTIDVKGPGA
jgi:hypothetical protein